MTAPVTVVCDREYRTVDKAAWLAGAWQDEPDKAQWVDAATDFDCLVVRNTAGGLCGYVGLPRQHPWHGKEYGDCLRGCPEDDYCCGHSPDGRVGVHGGLTFSNCCAEGRDETVGVCHVPLPGRPHDVWWFGFDCGHSGDLLPEPHFAKYFGDGVYRDFAYVQAECVRLAAQLAMVTAP